MKLADYEFKIGDKVITITGEVGEIIDICKCKKCVERGFCEPMWKKSDDVYVDYIDIYQAEAGFPGFYQIGSYGFHDFDKGEVFRQIAYHEEQLWKLKKQLKVIEEVE